jgi:hypothetical protein
MEKHFKDAHQHSSKHRSELDASDYCGCFYCLHIFIADDVQVWWDNGQTATCPNCGVYSVLGDASDYPITTDFLKLMKHNWF